MAAVLHNLRLRGTSVLIATAAYDVNVYKSARNLARVTVSPVTDLNAWSVLKPARLVVTRAALDALRRKSPAAAEPA
jgi:large subunit ribosomal protein L4